MLAVPRDPLVHVEWHRVLFLNYVIDPAVVRAFVPREFELDLYEGKACVSLVRVIMRNYRRAPNAPLWGGVMTTGGGLVFFGTPEGYLKAADAKTGKVLWQFQTGSGVVAPPITWEQDGEQYVAVASGWGGAVPLWGGDVAKKVNYLNQGGSMWVFKLHKAMQVAGNR